MDISVELGQLLFLVMQAIRPSDRANAAQISKKHIRNCKCRSFKCDSNSIASLRLAFESVISRSGLLK